MQRVSICEREMKKIKQFLKKCVLCWLKYLCLLEGILQHKNASTNIDKISVHDLDAKKLQMIS